MSKIIATVCILIISLLAFALTAVMIAGIMGYKIFNWGFENMKIYSGGTSVLLKEDSVTLADIQNLNLDVLSHGVRIRSTGGDRLTVRQYGSPRSDSQDMFTLSKDGGAVSIEMRNRSVRIHIFSWVQEYIEVEIPSSWYGDVEMRTSSGGIKIEDSFEWRGLSMRCSSGGIDVLRGLTAETADISASSGGINLRDTVKAGNLSIKVSSGGIKTSLLDAGTFNIETSSGGMKIGELKGEGNIRATSGGIKIDWLNPTGNVDIRASSGGITVNVPGTLSHLVSTRATSGGIRVNER